MCSGDSAVAVHLLMQNRWYYSSSYTVCATICPFSLFYLLNNYVKNSRFILR